VLVNGHYCPIVGNICMNMCFVDLSALENAKELKGATVILTGKDEWNNEINLEEWATATNSITYEVSCGFNPKLPRFIV
jgi:alanine racemase